MSLATRCPVCQTVFRVVQDQLKVSEGWVRCGRCAKVFNAFEGLFDLEREFPALRSPTPSQRVLDDLATRNRQPKPPSPWQDDVETLAAVRDASGATHPPQPASGPVPGAAGATAPLRRNTGPAPLDALATDPDADATVGPGARGGAVTSSVALEPAAVQPSSAASTRPADASAAPTRAPARAPANAPAPTPTVAETHPAPMAARATTAAPAQPAPAAEPLIGIRAEPAFLPGERAAAVAPPEDPAFEALFKSDGEAEGPVSTRDDVDIVLDGPGVEPAALDSGDAVDSRLLTFVQQADQAERWRRPWVRVSLAVAALVLVLLLAAQLVIARRDAVVSRWPDSRAWVRALTEPLGLRIEPLRRIDQLSVESSGLTRIDDGPVYRLVLVLRNRADSSLLVPAIDLSLTDATGALVTRRVLAASELGALRTTIGAGQELPLQALLMAGEHVLSGYTIEIFYP